MRATSGTSAEGIMDFNGHMSARMPGSDHLFINAREVSRVSVRSEDIVTVDSSGRQVAGEGTPPSETPIHTRIYAARPDVHSVAHLHPQFALDHTEDVGFLFRQGPAHWDPLMASVSPTESGSTSMHRYPCWLLRRVPALRNTRREPAGR